MIRAQPRGSTVRPLLGSLALVSSLLLGGNSLRADVVQFTGDVAHDFPTSATTTVIPGKLGSVAQSAFITRNGWTSGFLVESVRLTYDKGTDTAFVGVQTYSIAGDADGNGNPGGASAAMAAAGGVDYAHFGGDKSLSVAFANGSPTGGIAAPAFVAGIPADKAAGDSRNINKFTVATYLNTGRGLAYSYGTILDNHVGSLAVDPSAARPNFEFAVTNISKIPGFNPSKGFYVSLFLGSQSAIVVGKENIDWTFVKPLAPAPAGISAGGGPIVPPSPVPTPAPEPSSVVLFLIGAAGLGYGAFFRRRASLAPAS